MGIIVSCICTVTLLNKGANLMFKKREQVYTVKEFMHRKTGDKVAETGSKPYGLIPLAVAPFLQGTHAFASTVATNADTYDKVVKAFDPLIGLVQALSYPVAMIVVLGGALFVMIGDKSKGFSMMQGAGLGYVLVQLTPLMLDILVSALRGL
jgi:hypothetical protein